MNPVWHYLDKSSNSWIEASESSSIEDEYQNHLNGKRQGQRVYHCFGNGSTACINFKDMSTYCGSGRCQLNHHGRDIKDDHMDYKLRRVI